MVDLRVGNPRRNFFGGDGDHLNLRPTELETFRGQPHKEVWIRDWRHINSSGKF